MTTNFDVPSTWYESFFTAPVNRFWEEMVPDDVTRADVAFILRHAGVKQSSHIADLACGAGRHSLALARLGHRVAGYDISADAIGRATEAAAEAELPVSFVEADLRTATLPPGLDAILWLGSSLSYFEPESLPGLVAGFISTLRPGGRMVFESYCCAESLFPLEADREMQFDGGSYRSDFSYDPIRSLLKTKAELDLAGERHELRYAHHVVTSGELVRLLGMAGLRTLNLFGDTDDRPFAPGCRRLLLVAERE